MSDKDIEALIALTFAISAAVVVGFIVVMRIVETAYTLAFNKPLYVHFYPVRGQLNTAQCHFLEVEFSFYKRLSPRRKRYFEHRVTGFLKTYAIEGRDGFEVTDQMRMLIAGTYVTLTFGIKDYLISNFNKIVVYPESYMSAAGNYHKGEFNPAVKAIVFSWSDFLLGHQTSNDNVNLGLHEFSHALHFYAMSNSRSVSMSIFQDEFEKVIIYFDNDALYEQTRAKDYFRNYAYTNRFEFLAVLLEHLFETPTTFKSQFPELFRHVATMINYQGERESK